jgi:hypothetical protein
VRSDLADHQIVANHNAAMHISMIAIYSIPDLTVAVDIIGGRARFHRQIVLKLCDTGRTRLLTLNDTVLKLF